MIANENILELETRRQIYNLILEYPGLHFREITRKINLSTGNVRYHLNYLIKSDFLVTKTDKRYTRYYASNKIGRKDKNMMNLLRQVVPRKIVLLLLCAGPSELYGKYSEEELADPSRRTIIHSKKDLLTLTKYWKKPYDKLFLLNKKRQTLDFHLNKLIDAGIIEKIQNGRKVSFQVIDEFKVWLFLAQYKNALSDELVDLIINWRIDFIKRRMDQVIDVVTEIIPNPYHI